MSSAHLDLHDQVVDAGAEIVERDEVVVAAALAVTGGDPCL